MEKEQIRESIFLGLKNVFTYNLEAGLTQQHYIKPEYLTTVCIAQSLAKFNKKGDFEIKLEESTTDFASSCLKTLINNQIIEEADSSRSGRVDIAVYRKKSDGYYPNKAFCCLEIKNINPSKYLMLLDVKRLICFFNLKDKNGANSCLQFSYFSCIEERFGITREKIDEVVAEIKKKYENLIKNSALMQAHQNFEVMVKVLENPTISEDDAVDTSEGGSLEDYWSDNFCRFGILIEFTQNSFG